MADASLAASETKLAVVSMAGSGKLRKQEPRENAQEAPRLSQLTSEPLAHLAPALSAKGAETVALALIEAQKQVQMAVVQTDRDALVVKAEQTKALIISPIAMLVGLALCIIGQEVVGVFIIGAGAVPIAKDYVMSKIPKFHDGKK